MGGGLSQEVSQHFHFFNWPQGSFLPAWQWEGRKPRWRRLGRLWRPRRWAGSLGSGCPSWSSQYWWPEPPQRWERWAPSWKTAEEKRKNKDKICRDMKRNEMKWKDWDGNGKKEERDSKEKTTTGIMKEEKITTPTRAYRNNSGYFWKQNFLQSY